MQTEAPATVLLLLSLVIGRRLGGGENEGLRPIDSRNSAPVIWLRAASFFAAAAATALVVALSSLLRGTLDEAAAALVASAR